ncbi:MAG: cytochrome C [Solidesulfovibrio sp.]|jgi:cytochrome c553|uniref:c-type cytochrome n=1 Tax=Solidesulfovibrio sp. TaxID=2910990 RepID=UPI002B1FAC0C|nr:cytochrome C [Solidesulfovibrio sp.]MEA4858093.1 cytochrome C [Solidesulfovibrio sp.]
MKRIATVLGALVLCAVAAAALAAGDAAKGEALVKGCACHKSKGDLNGVDAATLTAKMLAYKDGKGDNKAMIAIMQKQSPENIDDLAAYYAAQPKP